MTATPCTPWILPDRTSKKRRSASVQNILAGGKFLYYYQTGASGDAGIGALRTVRSFNRCKLNGSDVTGLTRDPISTAQLVGSNLYIMTVDDNGPLFYRMKIDKSDKTELSNFEISPASAVNGTIYYNGTQDNHYLYAMNTATDGVSTVWDGNLWYPIVQGDYVYYMDVENNYRLCRYSLSRNEIEVLTNERIDCFNVGYGYVYYQVNGEEACLKCMRDDLKRLLEPLPKATILPSLATSHVNLFRCSGMSLPGITPLWAVRATAYLTQPARQRWML